MDMNKYILKNIEILDWPCRVTLQPVYLHIVAIGGPKLPPRRDLRMPFMNKQCRRSRPIFKNLQNLQTSYYMK
jgi:hypothetical protein